MELQTVAFTPVLPRVDGIARHLLKPVQRDYGQFK